MKDAATQSYVETPRSVMEDAQNSFLPPVSHPVMSHHCCASCIGRLALRPTKKTFKHAQRPAREKHAEKEPVESESVSDASGKKLKRLMAHKAMMESLVAPSNPNKRKYEFEKFDQSKKDEEPSDPSLHSSQPPISDVKPSSVPTKTPETNPPSLNFSKKEDNIFNQKHILSTKPVTQPAPPASQGSKDIFGFNLTQGEKDKEPPKRLFEPKPEAKFDIRSEPSTQQTSIPDDSASRAANNLITNFTQSSSGPTPTSQPGPFAREPDPKMPVSPEPSPVQGAPKQANATQPQGKNVDIFASRLDPFSIPSSQNQSIPEPPPKQANENPFNKLSPATAEPSAKDKPPSSLFPTPNQTSSLFPNNPNTQSSLFPATLPNSTTTAAQSTNSNFDPTAKPDKPAEKPLFPNSNATSLLFPNASKPNEAASSLFPTNSLFPNAPKPSETPSSLFPNNSPFPSAPKPTETASSLFPTSSPFPNASKPADTTSSIFPTSSPFSNAAKPSETTSSPFAPSLSNPFAQQKPAETITTQATPLSNSPFLQQPVVNDKDPFAAYKVHDLSGIETGNTGKSGINFFQNQGISSGTSLNPASNDIFAPKASNPFTQQPPSSSGIIIEDTSPIKGANPPARPFAGGLVDQSANQLQSNPFVRGVHSEQSRVMGLSDLAKSSTLFGK